MQKTINNLRKKLKKTKICNKRLDNEIVEYHNDIIVLDQTNFILEKENTQLQKKVKEYEEVYLKDTKSEFDKRLQSIMLEVGNIKKEDADFYEDALKYLSGYIQALEKYSKGDMKEILEKIQNYKTKIYESQNNLHDLKYSKKSLLKKIDKVSKEIQVFKKKIDINIL